jgi:hypothetical protein
VSVRGRRLFTTGLLAVVGTLGCAQWPTRFERIDYDRPRVLDFVYKNLSDTTLCEGAPGDSMLLVAYLSGKRVENITWEVSWNTIINQYFQDTAKNVEPLDTVWLDMHDSMFSAATQVWAIKFKIPEDILTRSQGIGEIPGGVLDANAQQMLALAQMIAGGDPAALAADPLFRSGLAALKATLGDTANLRINQLLQALTAPVKVFATLDGVYQIESDFTVRLNRILHDPAILALLNAPPGPVRIFVNRNPVINFVAIHKIKDPAPVVLKVEEMDSGDVTYCLFVRGAFDPLMAGPVYERLDTLPVDSPRTITIDKGFTYYVAVDSGLTGGVDVRDSGITSKEGTVGPETYYVQWFYQHDRVEMQDVSPQDLMVVGAGSNPVQELLPPLDEGVTRATLWAQLYDGYLGETFRPFGSTVAEVNIRFEYTPAYLESLKSNDGGLRF